MGDLVSSGYLEEYLASLQAESGEYLSPVAEGLMQDGLAVTTGGLQGAAAPAIVGETDNVSGGPVLVVRVAPAPAAVTAA